MRAFVLAILVACSSSPQSAPHDAAVTLDGLSCVASGSCQEGPPCGTACCGRGEACISGTCMCGTQPACTGGNMCATPLITPNRCGTICCGVTGVCPGVTDQR